MMADWRSRLRATLAVHGIFNARPILILEEDGADIVYGDVNRIRYSHDRQDALRRMDLRARK